ncbi:MAG: EAL domain-containing protein [Alphaproteobacteria bacterium]
MSATANKAVSDGAQGALRAERDRFVGFAFAAADLLVEIDDKGTVKFASGAAQHIGGTTCEALIGQPLSQLLGEADRRLIDHLLAKLAKKARLQPIPVLLAKDGQKALLGACRLGQGGARYNFTLTRIIDPQLAAPADAERDTASGALSEDEFTALAGRLVASGEARAGSEMSFFELVGLDALQQRLDQSAFEGFLSETGAYLRASSVGGDAVGRLSDNKFGVIHSQSVDADEIRERIRSFARDCDPEGDGLDVSRQGVALDAADLNDGEIAGVLAYTIKSYVESKDGNLSIESLSQGFQSLAKDTASKTVILKRAIEQGAFDIVFQPIVALADRKVHHYEVLTRFSEGASPAELVALAENVGLIEPFDLAVLKRSAEAVKKQAAAGATVELAVNMSGRSLQSPTLIDAVHKTLAPLGELRRRVLIELTETSQIKDLELADRVIRSFTADGVRVCLDDFGAGAASFRYVQALSVDFVKIDGAYVQNMHQNERDTAILKAMVALCEWLNIGTIAERVETEEQAERLKALGVKFGQGWLFGKPARDLPGSQRAAAPPAARPASQPASQPAARPAVAQPAPRPAAKTAAVSSVERLSRRGGYGAQPKAKAQPK